MTRNEKIERAKVLRAEGLKYREIVEQLGVSTSTVYAWCNPKRVAPYRNGRAMDLTRARETERKYNSTHKTECSCCGGERPRGEHNGNRCQACIADEVDHRARQIEQWWAEGLSMHVIAAKLGCSTGNLSVQMVRFRAEGYQLPYRRATAEPKFPEQLVGA